MCCGSQILWFQLQRRRSSSSWRSRSPTCHRRRHVATRANAASAAPPRPASARATRGLRHWPRSAGLTSLPPPATTSGIATRRSDRASPSMLRHARPCSAEPPPAPPRPSRATPPCAVPPALETTEQPRCLVAAPWLRDTGRRCSRCVSLPQHPHLCASHHQWRNPSAPLELRPSDWAAQWVGPPMIFSSRKRENKTNEILKFAERSLVILKSMKEFCG